VSPSAMLPPPVLGSADAPRTPPRSGVNCAGFTSDVVPLGSVGVLPVADVPATTVFVAARVLLATAVDVLPLAAVDDATGVLVLGVPVATEAEAVAAGDRLGTAVRVVFVTV
jgi:hypothetical protein